VSERRCPHLLIASADGKVYHCTACGAEMVVAPTIRAAWGAMGVKLQRIRKRHSASDPPGQETLHLAVARLTP
jgi:hypothetical protein